MNIFELYNEEDISRITSAAPLKSWELDPIPTDILMQFLPVLVPYITKMCNASLREGLLPNSQRSAIVTPRLRRTVPTEQLHLTTDQFLTFSSCLKSLNCRQLVAYLDQNGLLPEAQSAYRRGHSTETAVLKVVSDFLLAADRCVVTLLSLLDMSSAFDTVDHDILIQRLHHSFGLRDEVLSWIKSFIITGRTQRVRAGRTRRYYIRCPSGQCTMALFCFCIVRKKYDSITSTLHDVLHWLPIRQRVDNKLGLLMFTTWLQAT